MNSLKKNALIKSVFLDLIGMLSLFVPGVGLFIDVLWAPIAAQQMAKMYPGGKGKIAATLVFLEEILPWTDVIPTFTLMWFYTNVLNKQSNHSETIEVETIE